MTGKAWQLELKADSHSTLSQEAGRGECQGSAFS